MSDRGWVAVFAVVSLAGAGCGGGGGGGGGGSCNPLATVQFTISATGLAPTADCVQPGTNNVGFRNTDVASHDVHFDANCGQASASLTVPAATTTTTTFGSAGTCTFHLDDKGTDAKFQGTLGISTLPVTGPGY